jgi:hypothetical protein
VASPGEMAASPRAVASMAGSLSFGDLKEIENSVFTAWYGADNRRMRRQLCLRYRRRIKDPGQVSTEIVWQSIDDQTRYDLRSS